MLCTHVVLIQLYILKTIPCQFIEIVRIWLQSCMARHFVEVSWFIQPLSHVRVFRLFPVFSITSNTAINNFDALTFATGAGAGSDTLVGRGCSLSLSAPAKGAGPLELVAQLPFAGPFLSFAFWKVIVPANSRPPAWALTLPHVVQLPLFLSSALKSCRQTRSILCAREPRCASICGQQA